MKASFNTKDHTIMMSKKHHAPPSAKMSKNNRIQKQ